MGEYDAKPEDMKVAMKIGADLAGTIEKLKANGFQYATAGDTRRLIEEIERLADHVGEMKAQIELIVASAQTAHVVALKEALQIAHKLSWDGEGFFDLTYAEVEEAVLEKIAELEGE